MRRNLCSNFLSSLLKALNYLQAFVGFAIVLYSIWMLKQWKEHGAALPGGLGVDFEHLPEPWFIYAFMGVGMLVLLITFTGHVATELVNGCCLCFYATLTFILVLFEAALVGIMVVDKHWEEDIPHDTTGELERLRKFVETNADICRWTGVAIVVIQVLSLSFALILRGMTTRIVRCDSDEYLDVARTSLLYPHYNTASASTSSDSKFHSDMWSSRMREKYRLNQGDFSYTPADTEPSNSRSSNRICSML